MTSRGLGYHMGRQLQEQGIRATLDAVAAGQDPVRVGEVWVSAESAWAAATAILACWAEGLSYDGQRVHGGVWVAWGVDEGGRYREVEFGKFPGADSRPHERVRPTSEDVRPAREHELKCWLPFFQAEKDGAKSFEVRRNDRNFRVGDVLRLREYDAAREVYTGREHRARVTFMLIGGAFGIEDGYVVMGLADA